MRERRFILVVYIVAVRVRDLLVEMKIIVFAAMYLTVYLSFLQFNQLVQKDRELIQLEYEGLKRELADDRLKEFIAGRSNFVDEEDLDRGTPALVEMVINKLD